MYSLAIHCPRAEAPCHHPSRQDQYRGHSIPHDVANGVETLTSRIRHMLPYDSTYPDDICHPLGLHSQLLQWLTNAFCFGRTHLHEAA
jgi:hypothetical protein